MYLGYLRQFNTCLIKSHEHVCLLGVANKERKNVSLRNSSYARVHTEGNQMVHTEENTENSTHFLVLI